MRLTITNRLKQYPFVRWCYEKAILVAAYLLYYPYLLKLKVLYKDIEKLHVGCGKNRFKGWINADISPSADAIIFLQKKLPFKDASLELVYSEHVIEHISYEIALRFVTDAKRVLKKGGVLRIAMPDLDVLVEQYREDWRSADWVNWPEFSFIETRAQMINIAFRWWGHKYLYNREELTKLLKEAGFEDENIRFCELGESTTKELEGIESREDSLLIAEAYKT